MSKKIKNGGLDQYDAERFSRLIFDTIRKSVGLKGLRNFLNDEMANCHRVGLNAHDSESVNASMICWCPLRRRP